METMMKGLFGSVKALAERADAWLTRHRLLFAELLSAVLAGVLALYNVSSGPLHNLNDIGGWSNRALFIAMTAVVHAGALVLCALLSRVRFSRIALRQAILTAGMYILLIAINQKSYSFMEVILPAVRAMQSGGLAAGLSANTGLSAFALTAVYTLSATPVYPMYMLKLAAIASMLVIAILAMHAADRNGLGIRAEALLALCVILPQGFMNAGCTGLIEVTAVALLLGAMTLAFGCRRSHVQPAMILLGAACALSGVCLYAIPVFALHAIRERDRRFAAWLAAVPAVMLLGTAPMLLAGAPAGAALGSCLQAIAGLPQYAGGAPSWVNLIPRALVEEIPQYAPILRHLPELDRVTYAQEFYTQEHYAIVMHGFALAGLALFMGTSMLAYRAKGKSALHRAMIFTLGALIACPNATAGAWLALDALCLYAIFAQPKLRLPACMVLFATMCSATYPMTEEVMLPMVYAFALCLCALLMLLDVIPMGKDEANA